MYRAFRVKNYRKNIEHMRGKDGKKEIESKRGRRKFATPVYARNKFVTFR